MKNFSIGKLCSFFLAAFFIVALAVPNSGKAQIYIPDLPSLYYTGADGFTSDGVDPNTVYLPAQPTFATSYFHPAQTPPAYVNVIMDGTGYPMHISPEDDGITGNGDIYTFDPPTGTFAKGTHFYHFETSDGAYSDRLPWSGELQFEVKNTPVILIPGIFGSQETDGKWIVDPILHVYDNILDTMRNNGFVDGVDLFTLPYDWHQSNILTGFELHQKIDKVKNLCGCAKVNLIAHSMGGLVAREYIQPHYFQHDVDQLVFLGTPHLGAPQAYLTWEAGEFKSDFSDQAIKWYLKFEAFKLKQSLFEYIHSGNASSLQELLPTNNYLINDLTKQVKVYPQGYPENTFLESLNEASSTLINSGVTITNIVGDLNINNTINGIRVVDSQLLPLWFDGYPTGFDNIFSDQGLEKGRGDSTVPIKSSTYINSNLIELNSEHTQLPTAAEGIIFNKFTGGNAIIVNNLKVPFKNIVIFKILSPADIVVIAPDGKRVGKDFDSNQEVNDIDGAFYSGFETDNEFVTIPNPIDGVYTVEAQGTGNGGEYTIAGGFISNTSTSEVNLVGTIAPGKINDAKFRVDATSSSSLVVAPTDITPPVITIQSPANSDYSRPFVLPINVSVTDTESGVASQEIYFDDTLVQTGDQLDLFLQHLGAHSIFASSTDSAGNSSTSSVSFRIVASTTSTIADVESAFTRGWISDKRFKQDIIGDLKKIVRWEFRISWLEEKLPGKQRIARKIERLEKIIDHQLAKDILKDLKTHLKKGINQQAYGILVEDVNWLINN